MFHIKNTVSSPFLHLAVRSAGVVDEAAVAAHAVPVDDEPAVEVQAVVVRVARVPRRHTLLIHTKTRFTHLTHYRIYFVIKNPQSNRVYSRIPNSQCKKKIISVWV